jgi:multiple sugar transport system ATP-binding protein
MSSVTIRNVRKSYGVAPILHGVSIDIASGEFVILVGPSGCGKSTLLRMLAGLESITAGEVLIDDVVVNNKPPKDRDIAMVFQSYALYPHMSVEDNMGFSMKLSGTPKAEIRAQVAEAARILGLENHLKAHPKHLSGGQRQRVAMGRAIVRKPKVFLFDEPLSNLDAKLRVQMRSEIKQNHQRLRTTTVYVTHDQIEAMTMADRIVVMNAGNIEQVGTPLELYDRPANLFVAAFIGSPSMNFIKGELTASGFIAEDGTHFDVPVDQAGAAQGKVTLGIRPEHFRLDPNGIAAQIVTLEPTGAETQVVVRIAGHTATVAFRERLGAVAGDIITIAPDNEKLHFFSTATGARLDPVT